VSRLPVKGLGGVVGVSCVVCGIQGKGPGREHALWLSVYDL
jgi:hypothetical protein